MQGHFLLETKRSRQDLASENRSTVNCFSHVQILWLQQNQKNVCFNLKPMTCSDEAVS